MKICKCGYITDNPSVIRCDSCGSFLKHSATEPTAVSTEITEEYVAPAMPVIYRADVSLGRVFFLILICLSVFIGYTIYKTGLPTLLPSLLALGIELLISLILITFVCLITANIMGISFGTLGSFILKMSAIIIMADIIIMIIPIPYVGAVVSFIVFIAMVERYFKLEWDGLIAFIIIVAFVYILGRLWLHGVIVYLVDHLLINVVLLWRYLIVMLSQ